MQKPPNAHIRRIWCVALGCAAVLVSAGGCGLFPEETETEAVSLPEPPQVYLNATYPVERDDISVEIRDSAVAEPVRRTEHYFKRSGRLYEILVDPNEAVRAGQLLATMPSREIQYQLDMARLDLQIAELSAQRLRGPTVAPIELQIEELRLEKQRRTVANLQERLEESRIRAEHEGVVTRIFVELSEMVREYQPILEVADADELELQMDVTPDEFEEFFIGQEALYETGEDEWSPATITQLTHENPRDDVAVRRERYVVHLLPDNGGPLRMNARYSVRIVLDESENTLVIPRAALREFDDRTYVRLLEGEARREVDVRVGIESQTKVEILEGLEEGDLVIGR